MIPSLQELRAGGAVGALDLHFARALGRLADEQRPEVLLAAAMVSRQVRDGHVCLDVVGLEGDALLGDWPGSVLDQSQWPETSALLEALRSSALVSDGSAATPLVLDGQGRLYLRRYWQHEQAVAAAIRTRALLMDDSIDAAVLAEGLDRLFPAATCDELDRQRLAALMAVRRYFCVVSGGPGTGKTFTVVKILALLVEQAIAAGRPAPRMTLVAPTGKAAAWLEESIKGAKQGLDCSDEVKEAIAEDASTIHRALGSIRGASTRFRHNARSPLPTNLVLVDEASMVNIGLMARLVAAVPPRARLILLGDKDQLASVEAGSVLGDICNTGGERHYSTAFAKDVQSLTGDELAQAAEAPTETGIWDCVTHLVKSYRYAPGSGIEALAVAINSGDGEAALDVLGSTEYDDVSLVRPGPPGDLGAELRGLVVDRYRPYLTADQPADRLRAFNRFRILCGHRIGPCGAETVNLLVRDALQAEGLIAGYADHYVGRPLMVTVNDYGLRLFNGDVGLVLSDPDRDGLRVFFLGSDGSKRTFNPSRLPPHETVFAMSVHKSQGSEFDEVAVVLPDQISPVISRELLYTAVTRARKRVTIHAAPEIVEQAIVQQIKRRSGLRGLLWATNMSLPYRFAVSSVEPKLAMPLKSPAT